MKQLAIFLRALVIVGAVEVLVMFILQLFGLQEGIVKNLLDAVLLTTVCAPLFYVWIVRPIAHNLSEPRIRESEEFSRLLLDSAAEAIYGVDLDGNCTFCNPASVRILGYERPGDLLGKNMHRLMHHTRPDGTPYAGEDCPIYQLFRRGEGCHLNDEIFWRADGSGFSAECWSHPIRSGGEILGSVVTFLDITERKRAETELRRAKETAEAAEGRFISLAACSPAGIFQTDTAGLCTYTNKRWLEITGTNGEENLGDGWKRAIHSEDIEALLQEMTAAAQGNGEFSREVRIKSADAEGRWIRLSGKALVSESGQFAGFVGSIRDITARIQAEQALRRAKEAAEASERAKSEFLANMSHEIRTPMNAIVGMTDLALDTELTPEQREYLNTVKSATGSLLTVINDILDFSKIEAGKLEMDRIDFQLRKTLEDTMRMLAVRAHEKGLELACRIPPGIPILIGDPDRLRQIIVNLAGNAIKFTATGEVLVNVEVESQTEQEVFLHFTVKDTGIGIPAGKQQLIFQAFAQADSSTTRQYGGTGLGLAIATRLVKIMGGNLWVESEPGKGSTFHFTARFSVQRHPAVAPVPKETAHLIDLPVLVVDDNATNRQILEEMLLRWGMRPTSVPSGPAALAALKTASEEGKPFPLMLLDVNMPDMDGFEVAEHIRNNPTWGGTTVMMLTSSNRTGDLQRCRELGLAAYLTKPVRRTELLEGILTALGKQTIKREGDLPFRGRSEKRRTQGMRILLAEDNPVNQMVAMRLLQKQECQVTVAGNGREALLALEKTAFQGFDVVLMDVQMPEMDGLAATAAIREREKGTNRHIPIVAMTAYAMKGDREMCLAAGMDAYVSKPIQAQELFEIIETLTRAPIKSEKDAEIPALHDAIPNKHLFLSLFEGDAGLQQELTGLFLEISPQQLAAVRDAVERRDAVALERTAHALKGSLSNFVASEAVQAAQKLESMGRGRDLSQAGDAYRVLEQQLLALQSSLTVFQKECVS